MSGSLFEPLKAIVKSAGEAILAIYREDNLDIHTKLDKTPVTCADRQANSVIVDGLNQLNDDYPVLSEESEWAPFAQRQQWSRYWLVDPLDGTQEFINGNGQFTVNIALIEYNYPLLGIVYSPTTKTCYWGGMGVGAFRQVGSGAAEPIKPRSLSTNGDIVALGSRSYGNRASDQFIDKLKRYYPQLRFLRVGSSLKGCRIAEGKADIYPRLGPTSEWDTGAVQAIVEGAGGLFLNTGGERFAYNTKESLVNGHFLILGDRTCPWQRFWEFG
ncbi:3'(2'),5'-bisphosphate nucleotidase CysQ [Candidatus Sororendozoicomonas aggregata]|uniref:3'(2'),5'-bisphosphate nucleotidase CysQ n=1 Tax=Candidatus Sororendozoicomonas aggregata TaxID=3073239 RepID=UPI002ED28630